MSEKAFNLLDEKWIRVIRPDAVTEEVSLTDALIHAHEYADLAGELPTQDVAVLRLLLAVLHTVFSRVDCQGREAPFTMAQDALKRWKELWQLRHFPEEPLRAYLTTWHERFWLFHPDRPFYQVNEAAVGTPSKAYKLNGEISQSNHKERLFSMRSGTHKEQLTYAEAARWLLNVNGFDDTSAKTSEKNVPSISIGWLGKLGLIVAEGKTLFETLMLNLVLLPRGKLYREKEQPYWEQDIPRTAQRVEIPIPHNAAGLLTLQSRHILLQRNEDMVTGYTLQGGDFFPEENALQEHMTAWISVTDKKKNFLYYRPRRHDSTRQMWRDFGAIFAIQQDKVNRKPGIVDWVILLQGQLNARAGAAILDKTEMINFRIAGIEYDDKRSSVTQVFSDHLTFHTELLTEAGIEGYKKAVEEIGQMEKAATCIGWLSEDLNRAAGGRGRVQVDSVKARFFELVDVPFRMWLSALDPERGAEALTRQQVEWQERARRLALQLGREMVDQAGTAAFVGRTVRSEHDKTVTGETYSAPKAYNRFRSRLNKLYPSNREMGE